jgi:two-component system sensor histidine kinase KdpD
MRGYAWALAATAACTAAGMAMRGRFDLVNIAMVYLLAVVIVSLRYSHGPAIATTVLSVAAFDFLFVPPQGMFTVDDLQYLLTFAIMLAVGLIIVGLKESVRRQTAAQAQLNARAETERIRSTLLASISHDLRTPLAVMSGASSSLAESGERMSADERRALARSVFDQAREMSAHVDKVLQMTRLEAGAIELERDWDSLGEIAGAVLRRLTHHAASHRIVVDLADDLPLLRVDAALIDQVLANLLENALRHTPSGTVVQLRARRIDSEVVVSVEDFGPGLPDEAIERLFDKFHRASAEGSTAGMGLGLSICRAIVRLHGGRVWAERVSAGGLAFRFTLPVEPQPSLPVELAATS